AGIDQGLDDRLVGVTLFALVIEYALSDKARRVIGEGAVLIDGVGDRGVDATRIELSRIRHPDVEVFAAVTGCGVDEAGACVICDMLAGKQRDLELVSTSEAVQGVRAFHRIERIEWD